MPYAPLKTARIVSLSLLFSISVISGSVGLNALIKSNQQKSLFRKAISEDGVAHINTSDIFNTSVIITTLSALLAVLSLIFLPLTLRSPSRGLLHMQGAILAFISLWLFATLIPFEHFFVSRGPAVSMIVDGFQVPRSIIQSIGESLGVPTEYRQAHYLLLVATIPWFAILLAVITSILFFITAARITVALKLESADELEHVIPKKA